MTAEFPLSKMSNTRVSHRSSASSGSGSKISIYCSPCRMFSSLKSIPGVSDKRLPRRPALITNVGKIWNRSWFSYKKCKSVFTLAPTKLEEYLKHSEHTSQSENNGVTRVILTYKGFRLMLTSLDRIHFLNKLKGKGNRCSPFIGENLPPVAVDKTQLSTLHFLLDRFL